jgi:hypothetical protein
MDQGNEDDAEQARQQEADAEIHGRLDHGLNSNPTDTSFMTSA